MSRLLSVVAFVVLASSLCAGEGGGLLWQANLGALVESMAYDNGVLYVGLEDGRVVSLTGGGRFYWTYQAEHVVKSMESVDGVVYASSLDGFIHAINESGEGSWVVATPTYVSYDKAFDLGDESLFVGFANGVFSSYDTGGRLLFSENTDAYVQSVRKTPKGIVVVSDKRIFLYSKDGVKKSEIIPSSYIRAADVSEQHVAVSLGNNEFLLYDLLGNLIVNRTIPSQVGAVSVGSSAVYAGLRDNLLRAFSTNGSILWTANLNNSVVGVFSSNDLVAASTLDNRLYLLSEDGRILFSKDFKGMPRRVLFLDKHLIVATSSGEVADFMLPVQKKANALSLMLFTSLVLITSLVLLAKSWRSPIG